MQPGSSTSPSTLPAGSPWWATPVFHLVVGALAFVGGVVLIITGHSAEGEVAFGSGLTFLGIGGGVGLQPATR